MKGKNMKRFFKAIKFYLTTCFNPVFTGFGLFMMICLGTVFILSEAVPGAPDSDYAYTIVSGGMYTFFGASMMYMKGYMNGLNRFIRSTVYGKEYMISAPLFVYNATGWLVMALMIAIKLIFNPTESLSWLSDTLLLAPVLSFCMSGYLFMNTKLRGVMMIFLLIGLMSSMASSHISFMNYGFGIDLSVVLPVSVAGFAVVYIIEYLLLRLAKKMGMEPKDLPQNNLVSRI